MRDLELGRLVRALRRRRGWRQEDCAARAGVHRSTWSRLECGQLDGLPVRTLRRCLAVLEVRVDLVPAWRGSQIDRVRDEPHALLEAAWKERLEKWRWQTWAEVSYSHFGERGRIDLVAWDPAGRVLVVIEVKSEIVDVQALLGSLDQRVRLGPRVAASLGLPRPVAVLPMILASDTTANRQRVARFAPLFSRLSVRGREAATWLRRRGAGGDKMPPGLLVFSDLRPADGLHVKSVGSHRVRRQRGVRSVDRLRLGARIGAERT